jgi:adenylate cyclase
LRQQASGVHLVPGLADLTIAKNPRCDDPRMNEETDFEREGLLEGVDGNEREARLDLLRQLSDAGVPLDTLKRACDEGRLALLPVELVFSGDLRYTVDEVLEKSGLDREFLRRDMLALGLPLPGGDEPAFSESDLEAFRGLKQLLDAGFPEERVLELARLAGRSAAQLAEASLENFARVFLRPGDTERDVGLRFAEMARSLTPSLGPLTETPLRRHILELVRREVIGRAEIMAGELPGAREVTIAFADLVGFTHLSAQTSAEQVGDLAGRLERLAGEVAEPPVRLIKLIGDEAMLAAPEPAPLVDATKTLVAAAADDDSLPQLRAGVASGSALNRSGDWYGHPVNMASRLTGAAEPSSLLATDPVASATGEDFAWTPAGMRRLKGIEEPVRVFALQAAPGSS